MPVWISADPTQVQQVLMNLVVNARDAMPDGGKLTVALRQEADTDGRDDAVLDVRDTGVGMSAETLSHIFEPFFTTKLRGQGTGLGMSVIHGIITDHEGTVSVASEPGEGTCFTIRFPCCPPPKPSAAPGPEEPLPHGQGRLVLLAEDNEQVRAIMTTTLRMGGLAVVPVADGKEVVAEFARRRNDVAAVVLDIDLPEQSGLASLREIRALSPGVPVVLVTGSVEASVESACDAVTVLLRKPFPMRRFGETVHEAVGLVTNEEDRS